MNEPIDGWVARKVACDICGHQHVEVHPVPLNDDVDGLECPACGAMSCWPIEAPEDTDDTPNA